MADVIEPEVCLPTPNTEHENKDPASNLNIIVDLDQTLIDTRCARSVFPVGMETFCVIDEEQMKRVFIRPFARYFLYVLSRRCRTLSLWTNGAESWARLAAERLFPSVKWFAVLSRNHSHRTISGEVVIMEKRLHRMFEDDRYPHTERNTVFLDDQQRVHASNPSRCFFSVAPFIATARGAALDYHLVKAIYYLFPDMRAAMQLQSIQHNLSVAHDPPPMGLPNPDNRCYANAVVQVLFRVRTITGFTIRPYSMITWVQSIRKRMGPGVHDASEAMMLLIEKLVYTPAHIERTEATRGLLGDGEMPDNNKKPVWIYFCNPDEGVCTAQLYINEIRWKRRESDDMWYRSEQPVTTGVRCIVIALKRTEWSDEGVPRKNKTPVVPSLVIPTSTGVYALRGVVMHTGNCMAGHYFSMFVRDDKTVWIANDDRVHQLHSQTEIETYFMTHCARKMAFAVYEISSIH